ncbi:unnamed protein product, partial [Discosporangium mesarthrocarpum]
PSPVTATPTPTLLSKKPRKNPVPVLRAAGVILFIMLVGSHPFDLDGEATDDQILDRIANEKVGSD